MEIKEIKRALRGLGTEVAAEARLVTPPAVFRIGGWIGRHRADALIGLGLFIAFQQLYFWTGRHFLFSGALFYGDALYGWDVPRVIEDMLTPGANLRSNVHPFFVLFAKPFAAFFFKLLGLTRHTSAIAVSSITTGIAVVAAYAFFRAWGTAIFEAAVFAAIYGAGFSTYLSGAAPETRAFVSLNIVTVHLLACVGIVHKRNSQFLWWVAAVFTYGTTLSNVVKILFAYLATYWGRLPKPGLTVRVVVFLVTVGVACQLLTSLAGSSRDVLLETWMTTEDTRGGQLDRIPIRMARNFFLYSVVPPTPEYGELYYYGSWHRLARFIDSTYQPLPRMLAWVWAAILAASLAIAGLRRRSEDLRMLASIGLCLAFDFGLFAFYYVGWEGFFIWSPHVAFSCFAITVFAAAEISRLARPLRYAARVALCVFFALALANNIKVVMETTRLLEHLKDL